MVKSPLLLFFSHSGVSDSVTPWKAACQASLSTSWSLLKLMSIELVMPSNRLVLFRPLLLLPSIFPSIRVFSNESALHIRRPKDWSFSFSISPSNKYSGLISFRMDWLDLLSAQGTLKSLHQQHSSRASILQHSAFFMVQFLHPYMATDSTTNFGRAGSTLHLILAHTISKLKSENFGIHNIYIKVKNYLQI